MDFKGSILQFTSRYKSSILKFKPERRNYLNNYTLTLMAQTDLNTQLMETKLDSSLIKWIRKEMIEDVR